MDSFSPVHSLILLAVALLFGWPISKILQRTGVSRWWTILAFFSLLNIIGLWALSAVQWPKVDQQPAG